MPIRTEPSRLLKSAVELAKEAGARILEIYHSDFRISEKADSSPLTAADLAAHHCLVRGLEQLGPTYPILSEESVAQPYAERSAWTTYWLIDPLDGTREFVKRNGEFTVNIALIHEHQPILGVVHAPALETCYFAAENCGAFKQVATAEPVNIEVCTRAAYPIRVVGSRSHPSPELGGYLNKLGEHHLLAIGSSLKFCLVAEGLADLYPRFGPTSEWDTAAADCVVREAGGRVADLAGVPLRYNAKESILNPYFLVYGDKSRDWCGLAAGIGGPT